MSRCGGSIKGSLSFSSHLCCALVKSLTSVLVLHNSNSAFPFRLPRPAQRLRAGLVLLTSGHGDEDNVNVADTSAYSHAYSSEGLRTIPRARRISRTAPLTVHDIREHVDVVRTDELDVGY